MPRFCLQAILFVLVAIMPFAANAGGGAPQNTIIHIVAVWMKDEHKSEEDIAALIQQQEMLRVIPNLLSLRVGRPIPSDRAVVDSSYDIISVFEFESAAAMRDYLSHPTHVEFIEQFAKPKVARMRVYDFTQVR